MMGVLTRTEPYTLDTDNKYDWQFNTAKGIMTEGFKYEDVNSSCADCAYNKKIPKAGYVYKVKAGDPIEFYGKFHGTLSTEQVEALVKEVEGELTDWRCFAVFEQNGEYIIVPYSQTQILKKIRPPRNYKY